MAVVGTIVAPQWKSRSLLRLAARHGMKLEGDDVQALEAALTAAEKRLAKLQRSHDEAIGEMYELMRKRDHWQSKAEHLEAQLQGERIADHREVRP